MVDQSVNDTLRDPTRVRDWIQLLLLIGAVSFGAMRWVDRINIIKGLVKRVDTNDKLISGIKFAIQSLRRDFTELDEKLHKRHIPWQDHTANRLSRVESNLERLDQRISGIEDDITRIETYIRDDRKQR